MKIKILTLLAQIILLVEFAYADDQIKQTPNSQIEVVTNQSPGLKGIMSKTQVVYLDQPTIDKVKAAHEKMEAALSFSGTNGGPRGLQEAGEYLVKNVALVGPPEACVEYGGVFYFAFSGGTPSQRATNFTSGFAIKKGDSTIYSWRRDSKFELDTPTKARKMP